MRRWRIWVLVALVAWLIVVTVWAVRPTSDTVSTGTIKIAKTNQTVETNRTVPCDSPLSGNTESTAPLPVLHGGRSWQQVPCAMPIRQGRIIFALDIVVVLAAVVILARTRKPRTAPESSDYVAAA